MLPDILPRGGSEFVLLLCVIMAGSLTAALFVAAWRNHFWRHKMRPVVWASVVLFFSLFVLCTRIFLSLIIIDGALHAALTGTGAIADVGNILLLLGMGAWFYTVILLYPDVHRAKGEPLTRTSVDQPYND